MVELERSEQQHGVAEAEEAVTFAYGLLIGFLDQGLSGEGADEQQQGGARQVEIGNHGIHHLEMEARRNEEPRIAMIRLELAARVHALHSSHALQRAHRGCTDGDDATASLARLVNQFSRWRIQIDLFAVHLMLAHILYLDGAE